MGRYTKITNFNDIQAGDIVVVRGHVGIAAGGGTVIDASPVTTGGAQKPEPVVGQQLYLCMEDFLTNIKVLEYEKEGVW